MDTGVVSQARGSAYVEVGSAKVVCRVYGPKPYTEGFAEEGARPFLGAPGSASTVSYDREIGRPCQNWRAKTVA